MSQRVTDRQFNRISPQENWFKFLKILLLWNSFVLTIRKSFEIDSDFIRFEHIAHRDPRLFSFPLFAEINLRVPHTWIVPSTRQIDLNNFLSQRETACVGAEIWNWSAHRAFFNNKRKRKMTEEQWKQRHEPRENYYEATYGAHFTPSFASDTICPTMFQFAFWTLRFNFIYTSRIVCFRRSKRLHLQ